MNAKRIAASLLWRAYETFGVGGQILLRPYRYAMRPDQLVYLCECLREKAAVPGVVLEAGCSYGATTVFLNHYMADCGIQKPYAAMDTFSGFLPEHSDFEVSQRGKPKKIKTWFSDNHPGRIKATLQLEKITNVEIIQADVAVFDFSKIAPIAMCILDVDLYIPIKAALPRLYSALAPGGLIAVHDVLPDTIWDGAYQAYMEYMAEIGSRPEIVCNAFGIVRKPA